VRLLRRRAARRVLGAALIVAGAVLMWAVTSPLAGSLLFAAAIALEAAGIALERRKNDE
jgi:drug/metabolite transporter (DMT)-like permease